MTIPIVFLSRRNLLTLLSKLDRQQVGEQTYCTIIKHRGTVTEYQQTMDSIVVTAVDDDVYYSVQNRPAGTMADADKQNLPISLTGTKNAKSSN
jgi:hypothetical protein